MEFKLGQTVYHKAVYNYREPLKIVGIRETELELEGDYSGGTHSVLEKMWLPISEVSRIYDFEFKKKVRKVALNTVSESDEVRTLVNFILKLTQGVG